MEKKNNFHRNYRKYTLTSLTIAAALLAVNPIDVHAEEAEDTNLETTQIDQIDEEAARERGEAVVEQEEAIADQEVIVEEAEEDVNQNQEKVNEIEADLDEVDAEIETIEQEIVEIEEETANIDELEQAIIDGEAELTDFEAEATEIEENLTNYQDEVNQVEENIEIAQEQLEAEQETLADLEDERANLDEGSAESVIGENEIALPDGYVEALTDFSESGPATPEDIAAVQAVAQPGFDLNMPYQSRAEDQAVVIEDVTNLENDVAIELAQFTAQLLNPIRRAFGAEDLIPNQSAIDMANDIAVTYERDGHNPFESPGHHVPGIEEVAGEYGLNQGQYYENLGISSAATGSNLDEVKGNIYSMILRMLFRDAESAHGHALSLVGLMNDGVEGFLGVSFSTVPASTGSFDANNIHFISVPNSQVYLQNSTTFDTTANLPYVTEDRSDEMVELDRQIEEQREVVNSAEGYLANLQDGLTNYQGIVAQLEDELAVARQEITDLTSTLDAQRTRLEELQNADEIIADLEAQLTDRVAERETLYALFNTAQADLEAAQTNLANEQALLAELQAELVELKQAPYILEAEREEAIPFETELVYNADLLAGTEELTQAGVDGLRWLLENVVYLGDEVVNRFIVSSTILEEPIPEIIQVGTAAAVIEDIATENEAEEDTEAPTETVNPTDPIDVIETSNSEVTVVIDGQQLPPTGESSMGITTSLGLLFTTIGAAFGWKKKD